MEYYLWVKALHVVAVVSWFVVLFYLPRLFVYHTLNKDKVDFVSVVKVQESKLFFFIGTPSLVISILTGVGMIMINTDLFRSGMWIHIKLLFVLFLVIFHIDCGRHLINLKNDRYTNSAKYYKIYNEVLTLFLFIIVFCAVLKF